MDYIFPMIFLISQLLRFFYYMHVFFMHLAPMPENLTNTSPQKTISNRKN